jgi:hypothetical protein
MNSSDLDVAAALGRYLITMSTPSIGSRWMSAKSLGPHAQAGLGDHSRVRRACLCSHGCPPAIYLDLAALAKDWLEQRTIPPVAAIEKG